MCVCISSTLSCARIIFYWRLDHSVWYYYSVRSTASSLSLILKLTGIFKFDIEVHWHELSVPFLAGLHAELVDAAESFGAFSGGND